MRVGPEVAHLEHRQLPAPQPVGVAGLERNGVPQGRQPAFAPGGVLAVDVVVEMVEQPLQLGPGERPAPRCDSVVGRVPGRVPLEDHLGGHVPERLLAEGHPSVDRGREVGAERRDRAGVRAQGRETDWPGTGAPLRLEVLQITRNPLPGERSSEALKPGHDTAPGLDRRRDQPAGQHLRPPPVQHRLEHPLVGAEQSDVGVGQDGRHLARYSDHPNPTSPWNRASDAGNLRSPAPR